jgi:hypothetical protein
MALWASENKAKLQQLLTMLNAEVKVVHGNNAILK